jgi:hypothetical protein
MGNDNTASRIVVCSAGHFFDEQINETCPFCVENSAAIHFNSMPDGAPTVPPDATSTQPVDKLPLDFASTQPPPVPEPGRGQPPVIVPVQCAAGHWWDPHAAGSCPHCTEDERKRKRRVGLLIGFFLTAAALVAAGFYLWPRYGASVMQSIRALEGVNSTAPVNPAIASFDAVPAQIESGESSTLRWSVANATRMEIDHGVGPVSGQEVQVHPDATTLYTMTASGQGTEVTRGVLVTVKAKADILPPPAPSPAIVSFTADPEKIDKGQGTTLHWSVQNSDHLTIDHGVGPVEGNQATVHPEVTTSYTLTAANSVGSVTGHVEVSVNPPPPPAPAIDEFTAIPDKIERGQFSMLHWSVKNASGVTIDNSIGAVSGNQVMVKPDSTTTYTMTAVGAGPVATRTAKIVVSEPAPQSGVLHCSGVAIPPNGRQDFPDPLPAGRLHFEFDPPGAWRPTLRKESDGTKRLTLESGLPTTVYNCTVKWEVLR